MLSGVPQGSACAWSFVVLTVYIDDIHSCLSHSLVHMFADDIALYKEVTSPSDPDLLQADLNRVYACMVP